MEINSYDWFWQREKGRPCLVAGTAPSSSDFPYADFKGVYITCGDGPVRFKELFKADYWVNANNIFPIPEKHLETINSFPDTVFIFADTVTYCYKSANPEFLRKNLKVDWFAFDQRHFGGKPCGDIMLKCCKLLKLYPGRTTLQEYVQHKFNMPGHYSDGHTVAVHALAFAILMGCSPIYLQGVELPLYEEDYKYRESSAADLLSQPTYLERFWDVASHPGLWARRARRRLGELQETLFPEDPVHKKSLFYKAIPYTLADFDYLVGVANANGQEIYNLSKTSTLKKISALKYLDSSLVINE